MHQHLRFSDEVMVDGVRDEGSLWVAFLAALIASVLATALWIGITLSLGLSAIVAALAVAMLIGLTIRLAGNGSSPLFGLLAATFTAISCLAGQLIVAIHFSTSTRIDFYAALQETDLAQLIGTLAAQTSFLMYGVYAVALVASYRFAIR